MSRLTSLAQKKWLLLAVSGLFVVFASSSATLGYYLKADPLDLQTRTIICGLLGFSVGQVALLSIGITLLKVSFWWRLAIHWVILATLTASLFTGFLVAGEFDPPASEILMVCLSIPLLCCSFQGPLWSLRIIRRWRVVFPQFSPADHPEKPLCIADILNGTAIMAASLAAARWSSALSSSYWAEMAITALATVLISLLGATPAVWCIIRLQNRVIGFSLWTGYAALLCFFVLAFNMQGAELVMLALLSLAFGLGVPLMIFRSFGARLESRSDDHPPRLPRFTTSRMLQACDIL